MGLYKLSSQFTDFVKARSSNPEKILEQVSDAIEDLGEKGYPLPGGASVLEAFHSSNVGGEDVDDKFIIDHLGGEKAAPFINMMYKTLGDLAGTGKIDMVTRKMIETFLKSWTPLKVEDRIAPTVIRRKRPEEVEIIEEPMEQIASLHGLLAKVGVLEELPDFEERKVRIAERSFEWLKIAK
jgi:hypothetical protein